MIVLSILLALAAVAIILLLVIVVAQRWAITDITQQEKRREELLKAESTLAWIMRAKEYYEDTRSSMSFCFQQTRYPYHKFDLREHIPEYNLDTFGIQMWWSSTDIISWMDAFDTLAEIYKNKIKELCDGED